MSSASIRAKFSFPKLDSKNYASWSPNMEAHLATNGHLMVTTSVDPVFIPTQPGTDASIEERKEWRKYLEDKAAAAGDIWLAVEPGQHIHIKAGFDARDPAAMWAALKKVFQQKEPGSRFNSYDELFKLTKREDETLPDLLSRGSAALQAIKDLRPEGFTVENLDEELTTMAIIRALPGDYDSFVTTLIMNVKDKFTLDKLAVAFQAEESQRQARQSSIEPIAVANASSTSNPICFFCEIPGHLQKDCKRWQQAAAEARAAAKANQEKRKKAKKPAQAKEATTPKDEKPTESAEFAGHASACLAASGTASTNWNTDSTLR